MKILIIDDHIMFLEGISRLLADEKEIAKIFTASSGEEGLKIIEKNEVDILLCDIRMPEMSGAEVCRTVKEKYPDIKFLALTMQDDYESISDMLAQGANGYVLKDTDKKNLIEAIKAVWEGERFFDEKVKQAIIKNIQKPAAKKVGKLHKIKLSKREIEVLDLIAQQLTIQEIAEQLFISENTVMFHRRNLLNKFGARNSIGVVKEALKLGIIK